MRVTSKVTRHSKNEDVLRDACIRAKMAGTPFEIKEYWAADTWWTEITIWYTDEKLDK